MYAVEFEAKINNGKIEIPQEYLQNLGTDVRIIISKIDYTENGNYSIKSAKRKSVLGILKEYANPDLIPFEKEAWGKAVADKYANN